MPRQPSGLSLSMRVGALVHHLAPPTPSRSSSSWPCCSSPPGRIILRRPI